MMEESELDFQRKKKRRRRIKGVYLLPSLLTAGNMVCGLKSLEYTMQAEYTMAAWMILLATVFDAFDGKIARLAKAQSLFGINFDSLADLTSFGIAPAILIYSLPDDPPSKFTAFVIYAVFAAIRLARFNVQAFNSEKGDFTGMPTPAAAWIMAATYLFLDFWAGGNLSDRENVYDRRTVYFGLHVLAVLLAFLMVSRIRYPKIGSLKIEGRKPLNYLVGAVTIVIVGIQQKNPVIAVCLGGYVYLLVGLIGIFKKSKATQKGAWEEFEPAPDSGTIGSGPAGSKSADSKKTR